MRVRMNPNLKLFATFMMLVLLVAGVFLIFPLMANAGRSSITLEWDAIVDPDITGVEIFMSTTSGTFDIASPVASVPSTATEVTIENISNGTYYFVGVALDHGVRGPTCIEIPKTFSIAPGCLSNFREKSAPK